MKKQIEFYEVEIKFIVRKGSYSAKNINELRKNIENGIGKNDMECIEAEDIEIKIK